MVAPTIIKFTLKKNTLKKSVLINIIITSAIYVCSFVLVNVNAFFKDFEVDKIGYHNR